MQNELVITLYQYDKYTKFLPACFFGIQYTRVATRSTLIVFESVSKNFTLMIGYVVDL